MHAIAYTCIQIQDKLKSLWNGKQEIYIIAAKRERMNIEQTTFSITNVCQMMRIKMKQENERFVYKIYTHILIHTH